MSIFTRLALRTMGKNRSRTAVTIVGVVLSAAMFTAVTTSITSLQGYIRDCNIYTEGDWHVGFDTVPEADLPALQNDELVERLLCAQELGYAEADTGWQSKPYLYVLGADGAFLENMPVHLQSGRLPQTPAEIVLPDPMAYEGSFRLGDTITLGLGRRVWDNQVLGQHTPLFRADGNGPGERLEIREARTYTVVGFLEAFAIEDYNAPASTAVTCWDPARTGDTVSVYFRLTDPKAAFDFAEGQAIDGAFHYASPGGAEWNTDLLMSEGASRYDTFYGVVYRLGAILMGIIVFGSVSLIYNAFSISVSERTRQFGLLSSVGATRKQLRRMVRAEALLVSAAGIPLGLGAGVLGMGVTLRFLGGRISSVYGVREVAMRLRVSPAALGIAAAVALGTVLLSAWIPARRAMRIPAMEAIRQSGDVAIRPREVAVAPLTARLFGLEGLLARKHFKRSRRRYRSTVLSLFLSVLLFISASSLCSYLTDAVTGTFEKQDYDISYAWRADQDDPAGDALRTLARLAPAEGVTRAAAVLDYGCAWEVPFDSLPGETAQRLREDGMAEPYEANCFLLGVDEESYRAYLKEQGLDAAKFLDADQPLAVALGETRAFNPDEGRVERLKLLDQDAASVTVPVRSDSLYDAYMADRDPAALTPEEWDEAEAYYTIEETFAIGAVVDTLPFGLNSAERWGLYLALPMAYLADRIDTEPNTRIYLQAPDHAAVFSDLIARTQELGLENGEFHDVWSVDEGNRNLILVIQVFSYGFIALISLIAAANVFNTISTSLSLRRRELAMLQSVGMTRGGLRKMLNYECLLCGLKALLFGLPASCAVTYLIFLSISGGYETSFYLPWTAAAIAVASVFAVVFASMLYAMRKLRTTHLIDAVRSENL